MTDIFPVVSQVENVTETVKQAYLRPKQHFLFETSSSDNGNSGRPAELAGHGIYIRLLCLAVTSICNWIYNQGLENGTVTRTHKIQT